VTLKEGLGSSPSSSLQEQDRRKRSFKSDALCEIRSRHLCQKIFRATCAIQ
jgi:hypothetical protein